MNGLIKLDTGVPGLDPLLAGGIPEGRATLVTGKSGTGKTVLSLQIAAHLAARGTRTIYVAVEESPSDLCDGGDALGLDLSGLSAAGMLHFLDVTRLDGATFVSGDYDLGGFMHRIGALVQQTGARALVLDSATALFIPRPGPEHIRSQFFQLIAALREWKLTSIVLAEARRDYGALTTLGVEDYVCDLTIVLRNIVEGPRRRRSIEVNKYRRSAHAKGEYPCTIAPKGLAVFPGETSAPEDVVATKERFSSGVDGLDRMTCGGWLRNSIIIVRGPTGSGKTLLAGLYARAGAARGERVVYYGFEEPRAFLLRNYREIGMEMDSLIASGHLKVICRYAEATSLEDLLVELRAELEALSPSLIVMDSISSIAHSSSEKGFRQFMIGTAATLRAHGRTALLTQTIGSPEVAELQPAPYLSTVADAILALDYSTKRFTPIREMRVVKMRGSGHEVNPYRLSIESRGLFVSPLSRDEALARS